MALTSFSKAASRRHFSGSVTFQHPLPNAFCGFAEFLDSSLVGRGARCAMLGNIGNDEVFSFAMLGNEALLPTLLPCFAAKFLVTVEEVDAVDTRDRDWLPKTSSGEGEHCKSEEVGKVDAVDTRERDWLEIVPPAAAEHCESNSVLLNSEGTMDPPATRGKNRLPSTSSGDGAHSEAEAQGTKGTVDPPNTPIAIEEYRLL